MTIPIIEEELRKALIANIAPKITKRGINSLSILDFILITSILLMMNINLGVEKNVVFLVCITTWLLSVGR